MEFLARILGDMQLIELIAAGLGLINVTLVALRSVWNFPFGIVMVTLYGWIFFTASLYSDALLQIFFLVVQFYGWWYWTRGRAEAGEIRVELLSWTSRVAWLAACAAATAIWGWLMHSYTDAYMPWWDASVAMMSVAAQILMSRRYLENWVLWIAVDIVAIPLYASKALWLTSGLYAVFLALSIWGLIGWANSRRAQSA